MSFGHRLDMNEFAVLLLLLVPDKRINRAMTFRAVSFVNQTVAFERAILDFAVLFHPLEYLGSGIPRVH